MATSSLSQSPLILATSDETEWLEIAEFDTNTINEQLYKSKEEVQSGEILEQVIEVTEATKSSSVENYWSLDEINELENFNWLDMVEQDSSPTCNDIADWYGVPCMEEFKQVFEIGDYSLSHNANLYDEIGYIGLWQEN